MPIAERSSIEGPTLQRSPQTSRMGFASLVYPMSMVWASSLVRTSNTADSSLLLPHNKSLDASGIRELVIDNLRITQLSPAASTQPFGVMNTNFPSGSPSFGDNVRIRSSVETISNGVAGLVGQVYGQTTPSVTGVEVIGKLESDYAINVFFEDR